jgi:alpha/beta superfamily hydrolase
MPIETVMIDALDGASLCADLARVDAPNGAVVLAHPHPLYGGNRFNPIIDALFTTLPEAGFSTIRFDFRGVDSSTGEHDNGDSERLDIVAAIDLLELAHPDAPVWLVGYSFGSIVALNVVDPRVSGWVAIAPPLVRAGRCLADRDHRGKLVFVAEQDQFSPPEATLEIVSEWTATELRVIASTDHFLGGIVSALAREVTIHLIQQLH